MPEETWASFLGRKLGEYKEEIVTAKDVQDNQKLFNEKYASDEYKLKKWMKAQMENEKNNASAGSGAGGVGTISGSDNKEKVWSFLTSYGFSKECTAGIMGNINHESGFDPKKLQSGVGPGTGLIQWENNPGSDSDRWNDLVAWAKGQGKDEWALDTQLNFLVYEISQGWYLSEIKAKMQQYGQNVGSDVWESFKKVGDIDDAVDIFCWAIERPAVSSANMPARKEAARGFYDAYKDKSFSSAGNVSGNAAVQAVIAEAKKYLGLAYSQADRYGPNSYDCSSYLQMVFRNVIGRDIGINTWAQEDNAGKIISIEQRRAGDLLLFGVPGNPYHVALSLGGDDIYHAANPQDGILQDKIWNPDFWPYCAIRIPELE